MNLLWLGLLATRVVVWHTYRADEQRALERAAQIYSAKHPEVVIAPVAIAGEFLIPAGAIHNATNKGSSAARILATYIVEKGKPVATRVTK